MIHADLPPVVVGESSTQCDRTDKSPPPGCGRRNLQLARMVLQLNQLTKDEADPVAREKLRNAIASLGEVIAS